MLNAITAARVASPLLMPDAELDYWADAYLAMPHLARQGVTFEIFLKATPQVRSIGGITAHLISVKVAGRRYHLSGAEQRALHEALMRSVRVSRVSDGRQIEKMRHHRHPIGPARYVPKGAA